MPGWALTRTGHKTIWNQNFLPIRAWPSLISPLRQQVAEPPLRTVQGRNPRLIDHRGDPSADHDPLLGQRPSLIIYPEPMSDNTNALETFNFRNLLPQVLLADCDFGMGNPLVFSECSDLDFVIPVPKLTTSATKPKPSRRISSSHTLFGRSRTNPPISGSIFAFP